MVQNQYDFFKATTYCFYNWTISMILKGTEGDLGGLTNLARFSEK